LDVKPYCSHTLYTIVDGLTEGPRQLTTVLYMIVQMVTVV